MKYLTYVHITNLLGILFGAPCLAGQATVLYCSERQRADELQQRINQLEQTHHIA